MEQDEPRNKEARSYCIHCKKKRKREYMKIVGKGHTGKYQYECNDCDEENRMYGQNRRRR